jgi:hypothetical protein
MSSSAAADAAESSPVQLAMKWMQAFYTTAFMITHAFKVHQAGAYSTTSGPERIVTQAEKDRFKSRSEGWAKLTQEAKDDNPDMEPQGILSDPAYSFSTGPCNADELTDQTYKFDRITLLLIVAAFKHAVDVELSLSDTLDQLVDRVETLIDDELASAEMDTSTTPVLELMSGIVLSTNVTWLSLADLKKMAMAHGWGQSDDREILIATVMQQQIRLLKEIVDKKQSESCRGYDSMRARLQDNMSYMGMNTNDEYDPNTDDVRDRKRRKIDAAKS